MEEHSLEPEEERRVRELADRAQTLLDRRKMLTKSGKALALPLLVSLVVTRDAMGMAGSGGSSDSGTRGGRIMMMMMGWSGGGGGNDDDDWWDD